MKISYTLFLSSVLLASSCSKNNDNGKTPVITNQDVPSVVTFAGNGSPGATDGTKLLATFNYPAGIAIGPTGLLFIADEQNNAVRLMSPQGVVNTIAGNGMAGFSNATDSAAFRLPTGVAVDPSGNLFVADKGNSAIRKINTSGTLTTFATSFQIPTGVATDANGNIYVADSGNNTIDEITPKGVVTIIAGSGTRGSANGTGTAATFNQPQALAVDALGNIFVADEGNNLIREITPQGVVTTFAGSNSPGSANGQGTLAAFNQPAGVALDADGNVYVADSGNNMIRKITPGGLVSTLAGTGAAGAADGKLLASTFNDPQGVVADQYGRIYVVDTGNSDVRLITQ